MARRFATLFGCWTWMGACGESADRGSDDDVTPVDAADSGGVDSSRVEDSATDSAGPRDTHVDTIDSVDSADGPDLASDADSVEPPETLACDDGERVCGGACVAEALACGARCGGCAALEGSSVACEDEVCRRTCDDPALAGPFCQPFDGGQIFDAFAVSKGAFVDARGGLVLAHRGKSQSDAIDLVTITGPDTLERGEVARGPGGSVVQGIALATGTDGIILGWYFTRDGGSGLGYARALEDGRFAFATLVEAAPPIIFDIDLAVLPEGGALLASVGDALEVRHIDAAGATFTTATLPPSREPMLGRARVALAVAPSGDEAWLVAWGFDYGEIFHGTKSDDSFAWTYDTSLPMTTADVAFGRDGAVRLVFGDGNEQTHVQLAMHDSAGWHWDPTDSDHRIGNTRWLALAVDDVGVAHVAATYAGTDHLGYHRRVGDAWLGVYRSETFSRLHPPIIALDAARTPHLIAGVSGSGVAYFAPKCHADMGCGVRCGICPTGERCGENSLCEP